MTKYFIDTCVWIDFLEEGKFNQETKMFFRKILERKDEVLICKEVMFEMRKKYDEQEINTMFSTFGLLCSLIVINANTSQKLEAKALSEERNLPRLDCLFALLSKENKATLITQDKHILFELKDVVKSKRPREVT